METNKKTKRSVKVPPISDFLGRVPPQALELEEAVLGAVMMEAEALSQALEIVKADIFYAPAHKIIFESIEDLFRNNKPVDILTVTEHLKKRGVLEAVGGAFYIAKLTHKVASSANIEFYCQVLVQKHIQRELIRTASEIITQAFDESTDVLDLLDNAEKNLFAITEGSLRKNYEKMSSLIRRAIEEIKNSSQTKTGVTGVPSGFVNLDRLTNGWQNTDLIIIAARPAMGKTAFVLSLARNAAVEYNLPVAVFSLEMSALQLVNRMIAAESEIGSEKIRSGRLNDSELYVIMERTARLADAPIFIDDTPAISVYELRAKARRLKAQHNIQLLIVDYLQLMTGRDDKSGNREQEISQISRSLKAIAKELNIPVIALSQLNRSVEKRENKEPHLSDLRESGSIEQDADMVLFIHRPEYYKIYEDEKGNSLEGIASIIIAKHRNGPVGEVNLKYIQQYTKFENLDPAMEEIVTGNYDIMPDSSLGSITRPSRLNNMNDFDGTAENDPF